MTNRVQSSIGRLALIAAVGCAAGCGEQLPGGQRKEDTAVVRSALQPDETTIGPAGKNMNYFACAQDFGTCVVGGLRYMAYGVNNSFRYKLAGGTVPCTPDTFGGDPAPGVVKTCYISNYGSAGNLPAPLAQNVGATFSGNVAYGANGSFFFKTVDGQFTCNDATFGDPLSGASKACYFAVPQFTKIAGEAGPMKNLSYNSLVAYGAGGRFVFARLTAPGIEPGQPNFLGKFPIVGVQDLPCSPRTFGDVDPAVGVVKDCYQIVNGHQSTVPAQFLAQGGQPWTSSMSTSTMNMFYGDARNGNIIETNVSATSGTCGLGLADPDVGTVKYCWGAPFPSGQGTWSNLTNAFPGAAPRFVQLLMDGSVLVQDTGNLAHWFRLLPNPVTGYAGGTWTGPVISHYGRDGFASAMLSDGRFFAGGGEYVFNPDGTQVDPTATQLGGCGPAGCIKHSTCELYDPLANTWTSVPDYPSPYLGDGLAAPIGAGPTILVAAAAATPGTTSITFTPAFLPGSPWDRTATLPGTPPPHFYEGSFAQMQDGRIFLAQDHGAIYSFPDWTRWDQWPSNSPFNNGQIEGASALTLYTSEVFITGASGHNAIFNPNFSGPASLEAAPDTPDIPFSATPAAEMPPSMSESHQVVMPTGNLLLAVGKFYSNYKFYEYDVPSSTFRDVSLGAPSMPGNRLVVQTPLPDGRVLVGDTGSNAFHLYAPAGAQLTLFGAPTISTITGPINGIYTLTGTGLNGLTNGANCDDEGQNFTSFPIVYATINGMTIYGQVRSVSSRLITPQTPVTVTFSLPSIPGNPHGAQMSVFVSASGLKSTNSKIITAP